MANYTLHTQVREDKGKNRVDKLRVAGYVPGVVYHRGKDNIHIQVPVLEFNKILEEAGTSNLVDLDFGDNTVTVLVKDAQKHPVREEYLHVDFVEVNMREKIKVVVPVVLLNRDEIWEQPSILTQLIGEVEVECLPSYIPSTAEVNVQDMKYGDVMTIADLDISSIDEIEVLAEPDETVCTLSEPEEFDESEFEDVEVDAADVPEIGDEDDEEADDEEADEE